MSVGLVLAGGGARGAYEVGALSVLLPELERRSERPRILVGTSIGALNAAYLAAAADRPAAEAMVEGRQVWLETGFRDVAAPVLSARSAWRFTRAGATLLSSHGVSLRSVLDPAPMAATLRRLIPFERLAANLDSGAIDAIAVAATSASTDRAVVFHQGGGTLDPDRKRGIDYVPTPIDEQHVAASAAIPAFFPAAPVDTPAQAAGNYWDGGVRLNTPIKPALALGAEKIVVIGLDSITERPAGIALGHEPDVIEGLQQFLGAAFVQPLLEDMATLAGLNPQSPGADAGKVPYIFVGPAKPEAVGTLAAAVWTEHYGALRHLLSRKRRDLAFLGRAVAAPVDPQHGDLASYLFFCREFAEELLAMGALDAQAWLDDTHDDGPWDWGAKLE